MIRAYVINLDRDTEKWYYVKEKLSELGLDVQRIPGILYDGTERCQEVLELNSARPIWHPPLAKAPMGCQASHLRAVKTFLETGEEYCIILEDDITPITTEPKKFMREIEEVIKEAPSDWQGISLHSDSIIPGVCPVGSWSSNGCTSCAAYILNRKGAYSILRNPWKVSDGYRQMVWKEYYSRPENLFVTDESSSKTAPTTSSASCIHRLSRNVKGKRWHMRGEKSLSYCLEYQVGEICGITFRSLHIILLLLILLIIVLPGSLKYPIFCLLILFIPF